jgi:hypothetical protein
VCVCSLRYPAGDAHRHIVLVGLFGSTILFHTVSKTHDFRCKVIEHKTRVSIFFLQLPSVTLLILRRIQRDNVMHEHKSSGKVPVTLVAEFNETSLFSTDFRKILIPNFTNIRPVGANLFKEDGQTDRH